MKQSAARLPVLDGWRAISILLVLATHMLPLGPKRLDLNVSAGFLGMALFFTLSGFLITSQLHERRSLPAFFIRRLFRILPLAYAGLIIGALAVGASPGAVAINFLFAENYTHGALIDGLGHYWSLCVEIHFYLFIGALMWATRFRGFMLLPVIWLGLLAYRTYRAPSGAIETHLRVDEILTGCMLALVHLGRFGERPRAWLAKMPALPLVLLLLATCHEATAFLHPLRGLAASLLIGHSLFSPHPAWARWLSVRPLRYIAEVSYAVYVIHPMTMHSWLGQGETTVIKYAKRVLCFVVTFAGAHLSTFYYEQRFIDWAKRLARRFERAPAREPVASRASDPNGSPVSASAA